jgi:hypothetical protein
MQHGEKEPGPGDPQLTELGRRLRQLITELETISIELASPQTPPGDQPA